MERYLEALKRGNLNPNFWCSLEYADKAGWTEICTNGELHVLDSEGVDVLPPIFQFGSFAAPRDYKFIWSDLPNFPGYLNHDKEFLDYEYLFRAKDFTEMSGGKWAVFRKNSRKWATRIGQGHEYRELPRDYPTPRLEALLIEWLGTLNESEVVHDTEVLLSYLREGKNRWGLFTEDGELHAVNIFDYNWKYLNYRYCICKKEPFLSEYARLLFYQEAYRRCGDVTVCDGGCLDRLSLKEFKDRLNPVAIRKVHSWKRREK